MATFEISKDAKGQFRFKLTEGGKTLLRSEGYAAKASAKQGVDSVRKNAGVDARFLVKTASDGRPYLNLRASNGQIVATSPMCADQDAVEALIEAVKNGAADAEVMDNS